MFSQRTSWNTQANPLINLVDSLRSRNILFLDLTVSNPTECCLEYPHQDILKPFSSKENLLYQPEAFGTVGARQILAQEYLKQGVSIDWNKIVLTSSSSESYSFLFRLLLNPGDHILLPKPSYPLLEILCQINDVLIDRYRLFYDGQWKIDLRNIEEMIGPKTKAIVLVHPNNPTGSYVTDQEREGINIICQKNNLAIICDEVFWDYSLQDTVPESFASNNSVLTFTLGGVSKSLGLPQMKISWITFSGPPQDVQKALERIEVIADTYLSVSSPSQNALSAWLSLKPFIQNQISKRIYNNYHRVLSFFEEENNIFPFHVQGGWYIVVRLSGKICEQDFTLFLLEKEHVFTYPGYFFDFDEGAHLVLSLLTPEKVLEQGISRISECFSCRYLLKDKS